MLLFILLVSLVSQIGDIKIKLDNELFDRVSRNEGIQTHQKFCRDWYLQS